MKILLALGIIAVIFASVFLSKNAGQRYIPEEQTVSEPRPVVDQSVDFTATFTIVTRGVTRNFNAAMYHNLSPDAYIEASDPTVIHIKKKGVTWSNFFDSLPFKLTKDCLTTGTGETFCSGNGGTLKFYRNDAEDPGLLDREIAPGDHVLIEFSGA